MEVPKRYETGLDHWVCVYLNIWLLLHRRTALFVLVRFEACQ